MSKDGVNTVPLRLQCWIEEGNSTGCERLKENKPAITSKIMFHETSDQQLTQSCCWTGCSGSSGIGSSETGSSAAAVAVVVAAQVAVPFVVVVEQIAVVEARTVAVVAAAAHHRLPALVSVPDAREAGGRPGVCLP